MIILLAAVAAVALLAFVFLRGSANMTIHIGGRGLSRFISLLRGLTPPTKTGNPSITSADLNVGTTATATRGTYTGTVTGYNGQWYRGSSPIALATALTYQFQAADNGSNITYQEYAYNISPAFSSAVGTSNALGPIVSTAPVKTGNPTISGTPQVGQVLTATHGTYTGTVTGYNQQWFSGASAISGATSLTYTVQNSDIGNNITYQESAYNGSTSNASATGTSNALGPVTSGGASPQLTGMNLTGPEYYNLDKPEADYWNTGQYSYQDSSGVSHQLPDAPNGAATTGDLNTHNGWPTTAPSLGQDGTHYTFSKVIGMPPQTAPVTLNVTWTGNAYNILVGNSGSNWTSTGPNSGTFVFTQDMSHDRASMVGAFFQWSIVPGDPTPAKNFSIKLAGAGLLEPTFVSNSSAFGLKLLRFMKCTNAEGNYNIWPGAGYSVPYPPAQVTAATRNTVGGGNWGHVGGNPLCGNDGMPIERQIAIAAGVGCDVWTSINWNGSTDYYQAIANAIVANIGSTQKIYMEVSNEVWNGNYIVWNQANSEGLCKSIGTTITQMSLSGNTVTVTCAGAHNLVAGDIFTSILPTPYEFNCLGAAATIIDSTHFSYPVASTRASLTSATPSATGGTLATGTYYYKIAAVVGNVETLASNEVSASVTGPTGSVALSWAAYPDAGSYGGTAYKIYRGTTPGGESVYYATTSTGTTFTDTGAAATAGAPLTSTTITSNFGSYGKCMRWPSSFSQSTTLTPNGVVGSGSAAILRYAERSAEIFTIMEPIFQSAGIMGRIKRCLMLQQGAPTAYIPGYMDYVMPDSSKVSAHIDIIGCSSYFDPHLHGYPGNYTPVGDLSDVGPCITASYLGADDTIANCLNVKNAAALYGKGFGAYEGYYGLSITNNGSPTTNQVNFVDAVIADSRFVNCGMYFLQQWQMQIGNCPNMLFCDAQPASGGVAWGILQYMSQSISSQPKAQAIAQYAAGKVSITPSGLVYGTQTAPLASPNGTTFGNAPARGAPGSTYSIVSNINTDAIGVNSSTGQLMVNNSADLPGTTGSYNVTVRESNSNAINSPQYVDTVVSITFSPALVNTHLYRYYRLQVDHCATPGSGCKIAELELSVAVGGPDITSPSTTISANHTNGSFVASNAVDDNNSTYWFGNDPAGQLYPQNLTIDLGSGNGQNVNEVRITPVDTSGTAPSAFQLLGSDDGVAWTKLLVKDGVTWPTTAQQAFDITSLPVPSISCFDNFDENSISAKWTTGSSFYTAAPNGQTVQVANGELEILPANAGAAGYSALVSANQASFVGNYILFQRVGWPSNNIAIAYARVGPSALTGYGIEFNSPNILLTGFNGSTKTTISSVADPDHTLDEPTTYGWYRLRHDNTTDTIYLDAAAPSATIPTSWTNLLSAVRSNTYWNKSTSPNCNVALGGGQWTSATGLPNVRFDNFDTNMAL